MFQAEARDFAHRSGYTSCLSFARRQGTKRPL